MSVLKLNTKKLFPIYNITISVLLNNYNFKYLTANIQTKSLDLIMELFVYQY